MNRVLWVLRNKSDFFLVSVGRTLDLSLWSVFFWFLGEPLLRPRTPQQRVLTQGAIPVKSCPMPLSPLISFWNLHLDL